MIHAIIVLLGCQLGGEVLARALGLPIPGPVLGMLALVALLATVPPLRDLMRPVTAGFLGNLSLLFVPAGVGVVGHINALESQALGIAVAIVGSTALAIAAGALTFAYVARLTGDTDEGAE
jgi:putative effector of murein hydrolase LrgA (UPF0299 family)